MDFDTSKYKLCNNEQLTGAITCIKWCLKYNIELPYVDYKEKTTWPLWLEYFDANGIHLELAPEVIPKREKIPKFQINPKRNNSKFEEELTIYILDIIKICSTKIAAAKNHKSYIPVMYSELYSDAVFSFYSNIHRFRVYRDYVKGFQWISSLIHYAVLTRWTKNAKEYFKLKEIQATEHFGDMFYETEF